MHDNEKLHSVREISAPVEGGEPPLLTLTPKAVEMVREAMRREGVSGHGLRVAVVSGGCSGLEYHLTFAAAANEDDDRLDFDGVPVFVDRGSRDHLRGVTIDYVTGLHAAGFKFLNPNAARTCGCGSSFAT